MKIQHRILKNPIFKIWEFLKLTTFFQKKTENFRVQRKLERWTFTPYSSRWQNNKAVVFFFSSLFSTSIMTFKKVLIRKVRCQVSYMQSCMQTQLTLKISQKMELNARWITSFFYGPQQSWTAFDSSRLVTNIWLSIIGS